MRRLVARFALLALAGCAAGPDYVRPTLPIPSAWVAPATEVAARGPAPEWWKSFADPELDRIEAVLRQGNPGLLAALSRIEQARAASAIAGAGRFPSLQASAGATRAGDAGGLGSTLEGRLTADYEVDLWGKYRRMQEAAQSDLEASIFDREAVAQVLAGEAAATYFRLLAANDRLAIAQETLALQQRNLDILEERYRAGLVSGLDSAQAKTNLAQVAATLFGLEEERRKTMNALAILLGKTPGTVGPFPASLLRAAIPPAIPAGLPSALLERRPDLRRAEAALVAANAGMGVAKANLFPSLQLTASGGYASASLAALIRPDSAFHSLGVGLLAPVFQGGRLRGAYRQSMARYEELVHTYRKAVLAAFGEVEDALAAIEQQAGREVALQEAAAQAERGYRLALIRYQAGQSDYLPVLEADRSWLAARNAMIETRLARLIAIVALNKALGGGWQDSVVSQTRDADA